MKTWVSAFAACLLSITALAQPTVGPIETPTNAAGANLSAGTAATTGATITRTIASHFDDTVSSLDYCASTIVNNSSADAGPCLQATLNAAASQQRRAHIVGGIYYLMSPIVWPDHGVDMIGDGWSDQYAQLGSWIHVVSSVFMTGGAYAGSVPISLGTSDINASVIKDMAFTEDQPADTGGWTPNNYGPMIQLIGARQVRFEHDYAGGVNKFIDIQSAGGFYLDDIVGQFHTYGINIESNADYAHIHRIHVNDFWCSVTSCPNVTAYDQSNAVVIQSNRNDNPTFDDIAAFGVFNLINFGNQTTGSLTGVTTQAKLSNLDCDKCYTALEVAGGGVSAQFNNVHAHANNFAGSAALLGSRLLSIDSNTNHLDIANVSIDVAGDSAVYVGGSGNQLTMTGANLGNWGSNAVGGATCSTIYAVNVADTTAVVQAYNLTYTTGCSTLTAPVANGTSIYSAVMTGGSLTLEFGGATTGISQTTNYSYAINGHMFYGQFAITLTNVGSATGAASVHGLPFPPNGSGTWGGAGGGSCAVATNMASLTSPIIIQIAAGGTTIGLNEYGSTGTTNLTNSNFTSTSVIRCEFSFLL